MWRPRQRAIFVLAVLVAGACAPTPAPSSSPGAVPAAAPMDPAPVKAEPRTLVLATRHEPDALSEALGAGLNQSATIRLFNAGLALIDAAERPHADLAESLPQLNTSSWQVFPDGRMETTYRLKPNLTWHDGTPLSAEDFAFAYRIYSTPQLGVAGSAPYANMEEVLAPDPRTVLIRWKRPYPRADTLHGGQGGFLALPRHALQGVFEQAPPESFGNLPYWTREYLGLGPYRLVQWQPGSFLEIAGFAGYALGAPRTGHIRVMFIGDPNTLLANLLAGVVHVADETPLGFSQGLVLRREWEPRNGGSVLLNPSIIRMIQVQLKPEVANPRAVLDVRVRRALAHGIDKEALSEGLFEGQGISAGTFVVPTVEYYPDIERAITKYPYDPRRAEQLLVESGFARGSDGFFASASAERLSLEQWVVAGADNEKEVAIVGDTWRQLGIETRVRTLSSAQNLDFELKATFPGVLSTGGGVRENSHRNLSTSAIPTRENNFRGGINQGGWSNPEYDRLLDAFNTTLDRAERVRHLAQMMKTVSDELPWIPQYFQLRLIAHVAAVRGPQPGAPESTALWNVHQWEMH